MRRLAVLSLLTLAACGGDRSVVAPVPAATAPQAPSASVFPWWKYTMRQLFPGTSSVAHDINDAMQVAGRVKLYGFVHDLRTGRTTLLPSGTADSATAYAINTFGATAGFVATRTRTPAVWVTPTRLTTGVVRGTGEVVDLNDRNEAVGYILNPRGQAMALYWEVNSGRWSTLPRPRGATWWRANAINNDRVIVGESDLGGVMWTGAIGSFTVTDLKAIRPLDVDHGYGTVGDNGNPSIPNALFGDPDSTGTFIWDASARAVNGRGVAAGVAYQFFNPWDAFVADRAGNVTYLPVAAGLFPAGAFGINNCGAVAGYAALKGYWEAVVWDPGC